MEPQRGPSKLALSPMSVNEGIWNFSSTVETSAHEQLKENLVSFGVPIQALKNGGAAHEVSGRRISGTDERLG